MLPFARLMLFLIALPIALACAGAPGSTDSKVTAGKEANAATKKSGPPQFTRGNGDANWIVTEGTSRSGATLTFPEVQINGNGWLVLHPFKNGKPVGEVYVGVTYLEDGQSQNVEITVDTEPAAGEMFIVMLHRDVNENREFDFIFVDEYNVLDKAVFEGSKMIAHAIAAP